MRKKILFALTIAVIFAVGFMSGCGGCGCNGEPEHYDFHETEDHSEEQTTSTALPSQEDLGVPVYDENLDQSSDYYSETKTDGEVTDAGVDYDTKDDFETVVSFYKGELGEPDEFRQLPNGHYQAWWNLEKDGKSIQVIVTCTDEGTAISILTAKM